MTEKTAYESICTAFEIIIDDIWNMEKEIKTNFEKIDGSEHR
jgi:hypothetical protein